MRAGETCHVSHQPSQNFSLSGHSDVLEGGYSCPGASACHKSFTCHSAFDMHRIGSFGGPIYAASRTGKSRRVIAHTKGTRWCFTESEMLAKGMVRND